MQGIIRGRTDPHYRILLIHDGINHWISGEDIIHTVAGDLSFGTILADRLGRHFEIIDPGDSESVLWQWTEQGTIWRDHLWLEKIEPALEEVTGERIDLAILAFGRSEYFFTPPAPVPSSFGTGTTELVQSLLAHRVKKVLVLSPYNLGQHAWVLASNVYENHLYLMLETMPTGAKILDLWPHLDFIEHLSEEFTGWVYLWQRIWLNRAGHRRVAALLFRYIRQLVHRKPMHWPGDPPFKQDALEDLAYTPNWYLDE